MQFFFLPAADVVISPITPSGLYFSREAINHQELWPDGVHQQTKMKTPDTAKIKINNAHIASLQKLFRSCRTSVSGYTLMSLQLLGGAQSTRRFGKNAQTVLIGFLVVEWSFPCNFEIHLLYGSTSLQLVKFLTQRKWKIWKIKQKIAKTLPPRERHTWELSQLCMQTPWECLNNILCLRTSGKNSMKGIYLMLIN